MDIHKKCCFIGHRKIVITEELEIQVHDYIENLIVNKNVNVFLFGSNSDFNFLCHCVVTALKEKYPHIKRIAYTCRHETCILENERAKWEKLCFEAYKRKINILGVEEEFEHKTKYTSGRASYIERNMALIDDSDYCLFYYDKNYSPPQRKYSKQNVCYYTPKSGTALAFKYAKHKNKVIKNFI